MGNRYFKNCFYFLFFIVDILIYKIDDKLRISNSGFKFLLRDVHTQIWLLLLKYIDSADTIKVEEGGGAGEAKYVVRKELLSFLLRLSFLTFGQVFKLSLQFIVSNICVRDTQ